MHVDIIWEILYLLLDCYYSITDLSIIFYFCDSGMSRKEDCGSWFNLGKRPFLQTPLNPWSQTVWPITLMNNFVICILMSAV